jgi:hypothetical protein
LTECFKINTGTKSDFETVIFAYTLHITASTQKIVVKIKWYDINLYDKEEFTAIPPWMHPISSVWQGRQLITSEKVHTLKIGSCVREKWIFYNIKHVLCQG